MNNAANTTGLSILGFIKCVLIIVSFPYLVKVWQGLVQRQSAAGVARYDYASSRLISEAEAVSFGLQSLFMAAFLLAIAWAIWRFRLQYE